MFGWIKNWRRKRRLKRIGFTFDPAGYLVFSVRPPQEHPIYGRLRPMGPYWAADVERPDLLPNGVRVVYQIESPASKIEARNFERIIEALPASVAQLVTVVTRLTEEEGLTSRLPVISAGLEIPQITRRLRQKEIWYTRGSTEPLGEWNVVFRGETLIDACYGYIDPVELGYGPD